MQCFPLACVTDLTFLEVMKWSVVLSDAFSHNPADMDKNPHN